MKRLKRSLSVFKDQCREEHLKEEQGFFENTAEYEEWKQLRAEQKTLSDSYKPRWSQKFFSYYDKKVCPNCGEDLEAWIVKKCRSKNGRAVWEYIIYKCKLCGYKYAE